MATLGHRCNIKFSQLNFILVSKMKMLHKRCSTKKRLYLEPFLSRKMPQNILKLDVNNFL